MEIINTISQQKRANKRVPEHATRLEILSRYKGTTEEADTLLTELTADGLIKCHRIINSKAYTTNI